MIVKDDKGNELLEVIQVEETLVGKQYNPVNHALAYISWTYVRQNGTRLF